MKRRALFLFMATALSCSFTLAQTGSTAPSRRITLREAVQLALKYNHNVRIAGYAVDEKHTRRRPRRVPISHRYAMTAVFCVSRIRS